MSYITLITGGARSGKSSYALKVAEQTKANKTFIATCPEIDGELRERIKKHRIEREGLGWKTIEEQLNVNDALLNCDESMIILIDCLTLWINNIMYDYEKKQLEIDEIIISKKIQEILNTIIENRLKVIFVSNETGMGIVPDNKVARLYRDLVGRCNQLIAGKADSVVFVCSGLPLKLK